MENNAVKESAVSFRSSQDIEVRGVLLRLTRFLAVFEIQNPDCVLHTSEVLAEFKVLLRDRTVYSGPAVVAKLVNTGAIIVCEATLDEKCLDPAAALFTADEPRQLQAGFDEFIQDWGKNYKVHPDFKVLVADMQSFLEDMRLWLEQVELGMHAASPAERNQAERRAAQALDARTTPVLCALFEKFEIAARSIEEELQPAHRAYCRRQLHPLLLCSPFMNRIYTKPLGYAGDYEMVNMILRDPYEGSSLFGKLLNSFILSQSPAIAHRNRVTFLTRKLVEETHRVSRLGRTARFFNVACGPAGETQAFIREHELSNHARFTLLDSNDETLASTGRVIEEIKRQRHRQTPVTLVKKSVHQLLKQVGRARADGQEYDFIYCAGLFDYLNDRVCKGLMNLFYDLLAPGGLLVATNVDVYNPIRNIMEYVFEWHLVYRNGRQFAAIAPEAASPDSISVHAEGTSSNIFIEVRKPPAAK